MPFIWIGEGPREPARPEPVAVPGRVAAATGVAAIRAVGRRGERPGAESGPPAAADRYRAETDAAPRRPAIFVEQVMTAPVTTIGPEDLAEAADRVLQERGFRHLPVASEKGTLVGIVSDRDVLRWRSRQAGGRDGKRQSLVRDVMTAGLWTATRDTEIREVARSMLERRIGCVPIVDGERRAVGIFTTTDLLRCVMQQPPLDLWI